jgi:hypothetical protein
MLVDPQGKRPNEADPIHLSPDGPGPQAGEPS